MIQILRPNFEFEDQRGKLIQLVREGFSQFNIIFSKAGTFRGNHFHKINKEAFYVIFGRFEITAEKDGESETLTFSQGDMFLIPSLVNHSFLYHTDTLLASMYDIGVEKPDGTKDIFPKKENGFTYYT